MKYACIDAHRKDYPLAKLCDILWISAQSPDESFFNSLKNYTGDGSHIKYERSSSVLNENIRNI
jgi:hypothetical protein